MTTDTTEKGLETLISDYLCDTVSGNHFMLRHYSNYNRIDCVDEELLVKNK